MKFNPVPGKPVEPLPDNAVVAYKIARIESYQRPLAFADHGIFIERGKSTATLMTYGSCHTRNTVIDNPKRAFVFTGTALSADPETNDFIRKDVFEEIL